MSAIDSTTSFPTQNWSIWDSLSLSENLLDISYAAFSQIANLAEVFSKRSHNGITSIRRVATELGELSSVLYCINFLGSLQLLITRKLIQRHKPLESLSNLSMFASEILTPIHWLHEKNFLDLGRCAQGIGIGIEIFEGGSYLISAVIDCKTLVKEDWNKKRVRALINLIWFFLWSLGKILDYTLPRTPVNQVITTTLYIVRLSIALYDRLNPLES